LLDRDVPPSVPAPAPRAPSATAAEMKEYQAVVLRLTRHLHDDEDALTDLLNERSRGGWTPTMMAQDAQRLTLVFAREATAEP
jgi:hypothetical protein